MALYKPRLCTKPDLVWSKALYKTSLCRKEVSTKNNQLFMQTFEIALKKLSVFLRNRLNWFITVGASPSRTIKRRAKTFESRPPLIFQKTSQNVNPKPIIQGFNLHFPVFRFASYGPHNPWITQMHHINQFLGTEPKVSHLPGSRYHPRN